MPWGGTILYPGRRQAESEIHPVQISVRRVSTVEAACENTPDGTEVLFAIEGVGEQAAAVQGGKAVPPAMIQQLNAALNKIKKEG